MSFSLTTLKRVVFSFSFLSEQLKAHANMGLPSGPQPLLQTHKAGNREYVVDKDIDPQGQQHEHQRTQVSKGNAPADRGSSYHWAGPRTE